MTLAPPKGGFHIWLGLPPGIPPADLFQRSCREGAGYALDSQSAVDGIPPAAHLRLNFTYQPEAEIEEGLRSLGRVLISF